MRVGILSEKNGKEAKHKKCEKTIY